MFDPISEDEDLRSVLALNHPRKILLAQTEESIMGKLTALCKEAESEFFDAGIESQFSEKFEDFLLEYKHSAIDALDILLDRIDINVASEALLCLGEIEQPETYARRLQLLERHLRNPSPRIRSNAILAIASLKAEDAIPALQGALQNEPLERLRDKMRRVLEQLETVVEWR